MTNKNQEQIIGKIKVTKDCPALASLQMLCILTSFRVIHPPKSLVKFSIFLLEKAENYQNNYKYYLITEDGQESISNSFGVLSAPVLQAGLNTQHATKTIKQWSIFVPEHIKLLELEIFLVETT